MPTQVTFGVQMFAVLSVKKKFPKPTTPWKTLREEWKAKKLRGGSNDNVKKMVFPWQGKKVVFPWQEDGVEPWMLWPVHIVTVLVPVQLEATMNQNDLEAKLEHPEG